MSSNSVGGLAELRTRLWFVLGALIVYRIGSNILVPGLDAVQLANVFSSKGGILGLFNMFTGGALSRFSIFALGVMPYISASIVIQLMANISPALMEMRKEGGEAGRRKIAQYTRYLTVFVAAIHAFSSAYYLESQGAVLEASGLFFFNTVLTLVAGTLFLMWLGEKITEFGIGNGVSLIIFAGIASSLPREMINTVQQISEGVLDPITLIVLLTLLFAVVWLIVFIERGQRRISVHYAKRQQGRQMFAAQKTHLPLKINMAGVIPPIFASVIILLPATISSWLGSSEGFAWLAEIGQALAPGQPLYTVLFAVAIIFFCFFYTALVFNPKDTAENLKKSGAFVPGIRPGEQTASYIDKVMSRLTLVGAFYITLVALLPNFVVSAWQLPFQFGGTSLLIVVVVLMDFIGQVQSYIMSSQYESLMKKANLKGKGISANDRR